MRFAVVGVEAGHGLSRPAPLPKRRMVKSKTQQALDWLSVNPGHSAYEAAAQFGLTPTAVYRAQARKKGKVICPCCGQVVRKGFELNQALIKTPRGRPPKDG